MKRFAILFLLAACGADPSPQPKSPGDVDGGDSVYVDIQPQCEAAPETWKNCELGLCEWYSCYYICPPLPEGPCIVRLDQDWDCTWRPAAWSEACPM